MQNHININRTLDNSTLLNYAYLVLILTQGFLSSVLGIGGMFSAVMVLLGLSVIFAITSKQSYLSMFKRTPIVFWLLWVVYNFINWKLAGIVNAEEEALPFVLYSFVYPIVTMSIVYYEGMRNMKRTTLVVLVALAIYVFGGLFLEGVVEPSKSVWDDIERGATSLGNALPLTACILTFFSIIASVNGWISKSWLYLLLTVSFVAIAYVATRKALMGWCIIVVMSLFAGFDLRKPSNYFKFLLLIGVFYLSYNYIMDDTYIGERLVYTQEQGEENNESEVQVLNYLGDRAIQYLLAWDLFLEHPIAGIGLRNFSVVAEFPFSLHSEYMVQLCECGIIGSVFYLLFMGGLFLSVFRIRKSNDRLFYVCLGALLCMLFLNFTAWTYQGNAYFAMYGLILATCYHETKYDKPTRNKT